MKDNQPYRMKVIGAGFGRTGTMSLKTALEMLGFKPCYHMKVTLTHLPHLYFWVRAKRGEPADYRRFFRKYQATVDWPACEFYKELMETFPDAKVLLNVREPEQWYDSMKETIWAIQPVFPWWFPRVYRGIHDDIMWNARFKGKFEDKRHTIEVFMQHIEEVKRTVPADRLLVYDVKEGWEPLCRFLNVPVPDDVRFPYKNDRNFFRRMIFVLRIAGWAVPVIFMFIVIILIYWLLTLS